MKPIRVLQVVTTTERAGLETMLMNYYRHMDRSKVQFDFLRHRDGEQAYDAEIRALGGTIYNLPPFNPLNTNGYLTALDHFFREHHGYRVVHAHLDCLSSVPLKYAEKYGIPTRIAHSHVSRMTFDAKYPIRMFCRARIPAVATDLFACSEDAGKWMYGKREFRIIPNAIDYASFLYDAARAEALRRENGLQDHFVVAHVGRFDPVKNHPFLLEVFRALAARRPNSILLLAGTGSTMADIQARVQAYGLAEKVRFLGSVSNVADVLQMADAFVFPSLYEGLGISLIEAQAAGLPCFASLGCVPQAADITGTVRYFPLDSGAKVWADAILQHCHPAGTRGCADHALRASGYDIETEAKKLEAFYLTHHLEDLSCGDIGYSL